MIKRTTSILTAKSLLCSNQKAQLANHLFPSLKARGTTVSMRISCRIGPSSFPSTILARAIANCTSPICFKQTLTASLNAPPSKKNAAAYSTWDLQLAKIACVLQIEHTPSLFTQQSVSVFQRSRLPPRLREIVREELQHDLLFLMPRSLPPESVYEFHLAQRKVEQTTIRRIPFIVVHVFVPSDDFQMSVLWGKAIRSAERFS